MPKKKEKEIQSLSSIAIQLKSVSEIAKKEPHIAPVIQAYEELTRAMLAKLKLLEYIGNAQIILQGDLDLSDWIEEAQNRHREADRLFNEIMDNPAQLIER